MPNNVDLVVAGSPVRTGGILVAPRGTPMPEDATTDPTTMGFVHAGYVSEDGLTESSERSTEKIKAWGGDTVKVLQTDYSLTYSWTFIEALNAEVLTLMYGEENVETDGTSTTLKATSERLEPRAYIFDMQDGDVGKIRICVPDGRITETGETSYVDNDVVGYELTMEALRNEEIEANAIKFIEATEDPNSSS